MTIWLWIAAAAAAAAEVACKYGGQQPSGILTAWLAKIEKCKWREEKGERERGNRIPKKEERVFYEEGENLYFG